MVKRDNEGSEFLEFNYPQTYFISKNYALNKINNTFGTDKEENKEENKEEVNASNNQKKKKRRK